MPLPNCGSHVTTLADMRSVSPASSLSSRHVPAAKWVHAFDVASAEAQVRGSAMQRCGAAFGVNLDRNTDFESRILASFDHGPTSQSNLPLEKA